MKTITQSEEHTMGNETIPATCAITARENVTGVLSIFTGVTMYVVPVLAALHLVLRVMALCNTPDGHVGAELLIAGRVLAAAIGIYLAANGCFVASAIQSGKPGATEQAIGYLTQCLFWAGIGSLRMAFCPGSFAAGPTNILPIVWCGLWILYFEVRNHVRTAYPTALRIAVAEE